MLSGSFTLSKARTLGNFAVDAIERHGNCRIDGSLDVYVGQMWNLEEVKRAVLRGRATQMRRSDSAIAIMDLILLMCAGCAEIKI